MAQKRQTFLQGAFILLAANLMVKLIGAGFKIPLTNLIKADGMGLFNYAYNIYTILFIVATAGFPTAISKMVAESCALGREREGDRIFKIALCMLLLIGVSGSVVLFFGAGAIADATGNDRSRLSIMAIAPAVLCVSVMSAFRGYFQGRQNMYPTAISEVVEALGKLVFGILLAIYLMSAGIEQAAAGAVFGVTCGTFLGVVVLLVIFLFTAKKKEGESLECAGVWTLAKRLFVIAVPITIGAAVASLTNLADMFTVNNRLLAITEVTPAFMEKFAIFINPETIANGIDEELANKLYGLYTGFAVPLFNMPLTLVTALSVSVVPAISSALARRSGMEARKLTESVLRITILFAMPCAFGLYALSEPILKLLYVGAVDEAVLAASLLSKLSISIIFVSLVSVTTAILQSYGRERVPVVNMLIGGIIKVAINYTLVAIPSVNIEGAPIGTLVCYFTIVVLNMIFVVKESGMVIRWTELVIKPLIAAGVMGFCALAVYRLVIMIAGSSALVNAAATAIAIGFAVILYGVLAILLRMIHKEDVEMLPKGAKIAEKLVKMHILR